MNRVDSPPPKNQKSIDDSRTVSGNGDEGSCQHYVQFYESDAFLEARVAEFIAAAFKADESGVLIATPEHRAAVEEQLAEKGFPIAQLTKTGRYFPIDAQQMLSRFMLADFPDEEIFQREIGSLLEKASNGRRRHVRG